MAGAVASPWRDVFDKLSAAADLVASEGDVGLFQQLVGDLRSKELPSASQQESRELCSQLARLGERMAAFLSADGSPPLSAVNACCDGLALGADLLLGVSMDCNGSPGATLSQARSFCSGVRSVLGAGQQAVEHSLRALPAAVPANSSLAEQAAWTLQWQAAMLMRAELLAGLHSAFSKAFRKSVSPKLLISWLRSAADGLQRLEPFAHRGSESEFRQARGALVDALGVLIMTPALQAYAAALLQQQQPTAVLFSLALAFVHECAVALLLPPEHRPRQCHWCAAGAAAAFLEEAARLPCCQRALGLASDSQADGCSSSSGASGAIPAALLQWLRSAAQLVQHMPVDDDAMGSNDLTALGFQLGRACSLLTGDRRHAEALGEQQAHLARLLLPTIPQLGRLLELQPGLACEVGLSISIGLVFRLLSRLADRAKEDLSASGSCAAAALHLLPLAVKLARAAGSERSTQRAAAARLAQTRLGLVFKVGMAFGDAACQPWAQALARSSGVREAMAAVWQLHSSACRAVALAQQGDRERELVFGGVDGAPRLLLALAGALRFGALLARESAAGAEAAWVGRALRAMCAAHMAAIPPLFAALEWDQPDAQCEPFAAVLSHTLAALADSVPAGTAEGSHLQAMMALLARSLPEDAALCDEFLLSLHRLVSAPPVMPLAALMLASGLAGCLLSNFGCLLRAQDASQDGADGGTEVQPEPAAVLALIAAVEAAAGTEVAAVADSADAGSPPDAELLAALREQLAALQAARMAASFPQEGTWEEQVAALSPVMPAAKQLAAALLDWRRRPEAAAAARLELARAAAARSCAYLRCANLQLEGGPAAGERQGSLKCGHFKAVWYCDTACSHADWRGPAGHRKTCAAPGQARAAERRGQREQGQGEAAERASGPEEA